MQNEFDLKVRVRDGVIYEGKVISISSYNEVGKFDVLPEHANFISLINKGLVIREKGGSEKEIKFDNALMRVRENNVEVYLGVEGLAPSQMLSLQEKEVGKD